VSKRGLPRCLLFLSLHHVGKNKAFPFSKRFTKTSLASIPQFATFGQGFYLVLGGILHCLGRNFYRGYTRSNISMVV